MSRIGKLPIDIPQGVEVQIEGQNVKITGPNGSLEHKVPRGVSARTEGQEILVEIKKESKNLRALHGTTRAILKNMVKGVTDGWKNQLELVGTGYRAEVTGKTLSILIGYSHPVKIDSPDGISFKVEKTIITVEGPDKELVGQITAKIRSFRPPEPYKGKGIKYVGEVIRRKAGKAAKTAGAA